MQKILIILGISLIIMGVFYPLLIKIGFGRMPGDIYLKKGIVTFYFPIVSCIIISSILFIIIKLLMK
jgi:hypothetical protein